VVPAWTGLIYFVLTMYVILYPCRASWIHIQLFSVQNLKTTATIRVDPTAQPCFHKPYALKTEKVAQLGYVVTTRLQLINFSGGQLPLA